MKFLKNAIAFFAMLAVAAAGIFLPGYFLQKNGEEQLGAVRQPDGDGVVRTFSCGAAVAE